MVTGASEVVHADITWFLYLTGLETLLFSLRMLNFDHVVFTREISSVQLCPAIQTEKTQVSASRSLWCTYPRHTPFLTRFDLLASNFSIKVIKSEFFVGEIH